jgi:hypothetical protein
LDDAAFLVALVEQLRGTSVFLAGISGGGGGFAEHPAGNDLTETLSGVSGDVGVSSGLEKRG